jgi:hypothetical protein
VFLKFGEYSAADTYDEAENNAVATTKQKPLNILRLVCFIK